MVDAFDIDRLLEQATSARIQGDKPLAADRYRQAAELFIEAGDADNAIRTLTSAAALESELKDLAQAETTLRRALAFVSGEDVAYLEPKVLFNLARALLAQDRKPEAIALFTRVIILEQQLGTEIYTTESRGALRNLGIEPPN